MRQALPAVLLAGAAGAYPTTDQLEGLLQPVANSMAKKWNCSFSIAFHSANTTASVAAGDSDGAGREAKVTDPYVWGSGTKMLTGASIMRLIAAGKFSLDDPVPPLVDPFLRNMHASNFSTCADLWGQGVAKVTVRDLLGMTSGIPDFDTAKGHGKILVDSFRAKCYANSTYMLEPPDLLNLPWVHTDTLSDVCEHGRCEPHYSSTNFVLLGLIVARFHGASTWDEIDQTVVFPDALKPDFAGSAFSLSKPPSRFTPVHGFDRTTYNRPAGAPPGNSPTWNIDGVFSGYTASNFVSTASQMAEAVYGIYGPDSLMGVPREYVNQMIPTGSFYGLATFNLTSRIGDLAESLGLQRAYGHLGATYGYQSIMTYHEALQFSLVIGTDIETNEQQQPAEALCFAYNEIMAAMIGKGQPTCKYVAGSYYGGGCKCQFE